MNGCVHRKGPVELSVPVLDKSGSMTKTDFPPSRLEAAKEAAFEFVGRKRILDARDQTAVAAFDVQAQLVSAFDGHPWEVRTDIGRLTASGNTSVTSGLRLALDLLTSEAKAYPHATRRCILLSDGEHNHGAGPQEDGVLDALCRARVIVDTILIGNVGEALLRLIADRTGGTFRHIRDFQALLQHYRTLAGKKPPRPNAL